MSVLRYRGLPICYG